MQRKTFHMKRGFLRKIGSGGLNKIKKGCLSVLTMAILKDPTTSIRKHANELKVHETTVRTAIKQDSSTHNNSIAYAIWDVLENKTNTIPHPNIGLLKTALEEQ